MSLLGVGTRGAAAQASRMGWKPLFLVLAVVLLFLHSEASVPHYTDRDLDELRYEMILISLFEVSCYGCCGSADS